jgi:hypothetical protein
MGLAERYHPRYKLYVFEKIKRRGATLNVIDWPLSAIAG